MKIKLSSSHQALEAAIDHATVFYMPTSYLIWTETYHLRIYWRQEDNMHCYQEQWEIVPCTKLMLYYSVLANDTY